MSTFYYAVDSEDKYLFDNFPPEALSLIQNWDRGIKQVEFESGGMRHVAKIGRKKNEHGILFILTTDPRYLNKEKLLRQLFDTSILAFKPMIDLKKKIVGEQISTTQEFIHNVTSLNSHSIQELFALIPQQALSKDIYKQGESVLSIVGKDPTAASKTLLRLIKYSLAMKVEFAVFERTMKEAPGNQLMEHSIRSILLSVIQIFIDDFDQKRIEVYIDASEKRLRLDYDSISVSLYYILDNSVKYCLPDAKYMIHFHEEEGAFAICFDMISLRIEDDEKGKLCNYGYRSPSAIKLHGAGSGLGMFRINKTLKLNNAELVITPRINKYVKKVGGLTYEGNEFKIRFINQQDWFKVNMGGVSRPHSQVGG